MLFAINRAMKKILFVWLFLICFYLNAQQKTEPVLQLINYNEFQSLINQNDETLYVINFWATWCKPCIEEIPGFMEVNKIYGDNPNFKMILISLDYKNLLNTKVKKFIEKNKIPTDVYLMDDEKPILELMPLIDSTWKGVIPSTAFYKNGKKLLFHQAFLSQYELEDLVDDFL